MIALSPAARVYLACGVTDMRNYAECLVMRSARLGASIAAVYPATPLRIISASASGLQHGNERVGHLELSSP
jgi:hypothetical protein